MLPYQKTDEIRDRYENSIILLNKAPIFIVSQTLMDDGHLGLCYFDVGDPKKVKHNVVVTDPALEDGPFLLGYVNKLGIHDDDGELNYTTCYVTRMPVRQWQQGLCSNVLCFKPNGRTFHQMCCDPMFRDMILNKYPSFAQAKKLLKGKIKSVAFNRQLAIAKDDCDQYKLYYRGHPVAVSDDGKSFKLNAVFSFLKELLDRSGVITW